MPTVLATGAWLKNTACLLMDGEPIWSSLHGDLDGPQACSALEASVRKWLATHERAVSAVAHDLHPDFFSTQLAVEIAGRLNVPAIGVQHHHAHIAAVVAEHAVEGPVVGLALDGVGLGLDGKAWGGELLWVDGAQWERLGHLQPLAMPGGDRAAREPWRMAASALHALDRGAEITPRFGPAVGEALSSGLVQMLNQNFNCPLTSSTGRWFDAAAGALGLCLDQADEAEAAQALEAAAARWLALHPDVAPLPGTVIDDQNRLGLLGLMPALLEAEPAGVDAAAAGFHLALADALATWAIRAAAARNCLTVCLGGGCFLNRVLRTRLTMRLEASGLRVLRQVKQDCGDAGLALGQAWVAMQQLQAASSKEDLKETATCA